MEDEKCRSTGDEQYRNEQYCNEQYGMNSIGMKNTVMNSTVWHMVNSVDRRQMSGVDRLMVYVLILNSTMIHQNESFNHMILWLNILKRKRTCIHRF